MLSLPELIDSYNLTYHVGESETLNDKCSGLFNSFISLGSMVGPLIGGCLTDYIGYRATNDAMALFVGGYALIYLFFNIDKSDFTLPEEDDFEIQY